MTWNELKKHDLTIYSTTWCPDCRRLKQHLDEQNISYNEIDIDKHPEAAARLKRRTNRTAIPYVEVDGYVMVRGWHDEMPGHWNGELFLDEVAQELSRDYSG